MYYMYINTIILHIYTKRLGCIHVIFIYVCVYIENKGYHVPSKKISLGVLRWQPFISLGKSISHGDKGFRFFKANE